MSTMGVETHSLRLRPVRAAGRRISIDFVQCIDDA